MDDKRMILVTEADGWLSNEKDAGPKFDVDVFGYERELSREEIIEAAVLRPFEVQNIRQHIGRDGAGRVLRHRLPDAREFPYQPERKAAKRPKANGATLDLSWDDIPGGPACAGWVNLHVQVDGFTFDARPIKFDAHAEKAEIQKFFASGPASSGMVESNVEVRPSGDLPTVTYIDGVTYTGGINGMMPLEIVVNSSSMIVWVTLGEVHDIARQFSMER